MSGQSSNNDQPPAGGPANAPSGVSNGQADSRGVTWATDAIRTVRSIGPLSSLASLVPRLPSRRPLVIAGIAVLGLLGGAGAALGTTRSGTPATPASAVAATPSPAPPAGAPRRMFGPGFRGLGRMGFGGMGVDGMAGLFGVLHGQLVVAKPGGGYQTVDIQNGQVTAVSTASITLRSADGYVHTYAVTSSTLIDAQRDGIGSVKVGNQVSLSATVAGSTATAVRILDHTLLEQGRHDFGYPDHNGVSWPGAGAASGGQPQ